MIFVVCGSPTAHDQVKATHAKWLELMPDWDRYDMRTQAEIIRLYELSPNKHRWFPDSFPDVFKRKNLYHHKYNRKN